MKILFCILVVHLISSVVCKEKTKKATEVSFKKIKPPKTPKYFQDECAQLCQLRQKEFKAQFTYFSLIDCTKYCRCNKGFETLTSEVLSCPKRGNEQLEFNIETVKCDKPRDGGCWQFSGGDDLMQRTCSYGSFAYCTSITTWCGATDCGSKDLIPDPTNSHNFCICANGKWIQMSCPWPLIFISGTACG